MSYEEDAVQYESEQQEQKEEEDSREVEAMRKMFVGGLNRETTEDAFFNYFEQFGSLEDKVVIRDPKTQHSRGFGFITYQQSDSVEAVFKARPHELDGRTLDVKRAMPREFNTDSAHSKTTRLYIGGFKGLDLTTDELKEYLESRHPTDFGTILSVDFLKEKDTDTYKGFGFIEVSDSDFADRLAISERSFVLRGKNLTIKKAESKNGPGGSGFGGRGSRGGRGRGRGGYRGGYDSNAGNGYGYNNGYNQGSYGNYGSTSYNQGSYTQQPAYPQNAYSQAAYGQSPYSAYGQTYNQASYGSTGYGQTGAYGSVDYSTSYNQAGSYDNTYNSQATTDATSSRGGATVSSRYQPY